MTKPTALIVGVLATLPSLAVANPDLPTCPRSCNEVSNPTETTIVAKAPERTHSINVNPGSLMNGVVSMNYEKLWNGTHGLLAIGVLGHPFGEGDDAYRVGLGIGYRWHWRARQNSGFLGITVQQTASKGKLDITEDRTTMTYDFEGKATTITGNVGKRWMLGDAFNITLRFGLGYAHYDFDAHSESVAVARAARTENNPFDLLNDLPIGVEGELSAGYNF